MSTKGTISWHYRRSPQNSGPPPSRRPRPPGANPPRSSTASSTPAPPRRDRPGSSPRPRPSGAPRGEVAAEGKSNDVTGKTGVPPLLESRRGVGGVGARHIMEEVGISESRRVRGLGQNQVAALLERF